MAKIKLADSVRLDLNQRLDALAEHRSEAEKAKAAGAPNIDPIIQRCDECTDKIGRIKQHYFPNKK